MGRATARESSLLSRLVLRPAAKMGYLLTVFASRSIYVTQARQNG